MNGAERRHFLAASLWAALTPALWAPASAIAQGRVSGRAHRVLHIMSFDSPWRWTDGQFAGFKEGLGDIKVEFRVFQMDVKRNGSREAKEQKGREARALIDSWQPDLVYTSDDDAVEFITRHYLNQRLPFVFSGMNKTPKEHAMEGAINVTGVLEQEHFIESVRLLKNLVPGVSRLVAIGDQGAQWPPIMARIHSAMNRLPGISLVSVDQVRSFDEFKTRMQSYPAVADAVVQLGIFALAGPDGRNVPYQEVQKWVCQNSLMPDLSFWIDRVHYGVLASVTISEREQGLSAGRLARAILVEGKFPSALPIRPTLKGHPAINLARARQLGINVKSSLLLSSEVVPRFQWDQAP